MLTPIVILFALGILARTTRELVPVVACGTTNFSGLPTTDLQAVYHGYDLTAPSSGFLAVNNSFKGKTSVLGVATPSDRWIEVDLSEQMLYAWDGDDLFLETKVSTGLPHTPTPTGEFRVWIKLRAAKMEGGVGSYYYYLPNVPYVMFFENEDVPGWRGYGIHGTYWHNDFGIQRSHGCINTPTPIAEKLYNWASPVMPDGRYTVYSDEENPGIRVVVHE